MPKLIPTGLCIACNRSLPAQEFARNSKICPFCAMLPANDVAILTLRTHEARQIYRQQSITGRKEARRLAKLAQLEVMGKRCTHCHGYKKPDQYNRCAPMADGLQPGCRACNQIRHTILASAPMGGGLTQWHTIRDALRLQNAGK